MVARSQKTAITTLKDKLRIMNKLKLSEKIEQRIEEYLEQFIGLRGDKEKQRLKGVQVTQDMWLKASTCDNLAQINWEFMLDKKIETFYQPMQTQTVHFKLEDILNLELICAFNNFIKDLYGIC